MASRTAVARKAQRHAADMARTADGFVATPAVLAEELCSWPYSTLGALSDGARVLEPSAGDGALAAAILDASEGVQVVAVEPSRDRRAFNHVARIRHDGTRAERRAAAR